MYTSDTNIRVGVRINGHGVIKGCPDGVNIHGKSYLKPQKKTEKWKCSNTIYHPGKSNRTKPAGRTLL